MVHRYTILFLVLISTSLVSAQNYIITPDSRAYEDLKKAGKLDPSTIVVEPSEIIRYDRSYWESKESSSRSGGGANLSCNCMLPLDNSFSVVPFQGALPPDYRNDDASSAEIQLPFTFCLYGNNYTSCYINTNGNVSFGSAYPTYSSTGFPSSQYVMVAPFWADVDTRGTGSGLVYYKITPTHMIVRWQDVGYFASEFDKLNDFQLVITNGSDPILIPGTNINFCYGDMQWTTGSASSGINGFGGVPATVGANKGDGVDFIQMGRFDQPGAAYDGPFNNSDGIDWLDGQSMFFNVCSSTNIAPIASNISICDTVTVCGNDTLIVQPLFLSPELGQTTTVSVTPNNIPGVNIINSAPGNTASTTIQIISSQAPPGNISLVVTALDDGAPAQSTVVFLNIFIDTTGLAALNPVISGNTIICNGTPTTLSVPGNYDSYLWSNGSTSNSATYTQQGPVWVTVTSQGCTGSSLIDIVPPANSSIPQITGDSLICTGATTVLSISNFNDFSSVTWPDNSTGQTYSSGIATVTVNAVDLNNCNVSSTFVINQDTATAPSALIQGLLTVCTGGQTTVGFVASSPISSFIWSTGSTQPTITISAGAFTLTLTDSSGCTGSVPFNVAVDPSLDPDPLIFGELLICSGGQTSLVIGNPLLYQDYFWSNGQANAPITVGAGQYSLVGVDTNGCSGTSPTVIVVEDPSLNPQPTIQGIPLVCNGGFTSLNVSPSFPVVQWSNSLTTDTISVQVGTYTVTVTDTAGCSGTSAPVAVVNFIPSVSISGNTPVCPGSTVNLTANPNIPQGVNYLWDNSASSQSVGATGTGYFGVTISYANGCEARDSVLLSNYPLPEASFSVLPLSPVPSQTDIVFSNTSTITSGSIQSVTWLFGDGSGGNAFTETHQYSEDGTYTILLTVTSSEGCTDTVSLRFDVISEVEAFNVITPNGDGKNDVVNFKNVQFKDNSSLEVFNRWGTKIFDSLNYKNDWTPDIPSGVYYYILTVSDEPTSRTGFFHVLR